MNHENLEKFSNYIKQIGKIFKKSCISSNDIDCSLKDINLIEFLYKNKRTMGEIADELNLTPGTVTTLISNLISKDLVKREYDKEDRRKIYIILTDKGNKLGENLENSHYDISSQILSSLNPKEQDKIIELMEKINKNLK